MASLQSGGNTSVDTNALFNQFLDENKTQVEVYNLGVKIRIQRITEKFLGDNKNK